MSFNIIRASKNIANKYNRYLKTMFDIKDVEYKKIFERRLEESNFFEKGPYLEVINSFKKGRSIKELIDEGIISSEFSKIRNIYNIPQLHYHQEEALLKSLEGDNLIVSTGTGSGKTECFLIPILNELMREKENGTLNDGVRALIIYPMNALANDQIDRLRKMFVDYQDISFGCYTGQTKHHDDSRGKEKGAIDQYLDLNKDRNDDIRLRKPLKNERLSRDSIKNNPPHILITNYAMLEYLMLRPEDNVFFDGDTSKNWKYIILDEAHTYTGSTGIEVSMLLRRLMAKLGNKKLQYILTSATLGDKDSNKDVVDFAKNLCSVDFKEENIIRASRIELKEEIIKYELTSEFYSFVNGLIDYGYDDNTIIDKIEEKYKFNIKETNLSEYLYELLIYDKTFWRIKNFVSKPKSIVEIKECTGFNEKTISNFVEVASRASKNYSKLFDSRYHMFLRATEGVFITLAPHKDLFLTRKNTMYDNGDEYKVFEAVTCKQCHSMYLLGYIKDDYLVQKSTADSDEIKEAFYLGEQINDTDEDESLNNSEMKAEQFELCPHCGYIRSTEVVHKQSCGHEESHFVKVVKVKTTNNKDGRVTKCIACENVNKLGILRGFFSGQEASTSVIGTSLFEELPSHIKKVVKKNEEIDDEFEFDGEKELVEEIQKAKQFIAFSDSRQAAAYFSSYFSTSYDGILYGRLIDETLKNIKKAQCELTQFAEILSSKMEEYNIVPFDEYLSNMKTDSKKSYNYEKMAWQAILKELIDSASRNSLYGLGLMSVNFNEKIEFVRSKNYDLTADEIKNICMVFTMGMLSDAAIYYTQAINKKDKEFFTHHGAEISYLGNSGGKNVKSFIPQNDSKENKRLDYLTRVLKKKNINLERTKIKNLLKSFWNNFFARDKGSIMFKDNENHYKVNSENLVIEKNNKWYMCSKCKKLTSLNVSDVCPSYHCDGELKEVNIDELEKNNHYYRMYQDLEIQPLRIVEHTAQLNKEEAYKYQNMFKEQKLDVLSCSTTFEMGVDVGELETVFMRNMPPSASNYAQRAGRAGRSSTSAAFALTFCNKSNHDFNYFEKPTDMISGTILPPHFKVENDKICIRHVYSSALSFFFKKYPCYFDNAKCMMEKCDETGLCGYDVLKSFLENDSEDRQALKQFLKDSVPITLQKKFGIDNFTWVGWLFDNRNEEYPNLKLVKDLYLEEVSILRDELKKAKEKDDTKPLYVIPNRIKTYEEEKIISFLSKNNILPKYGFPVDTVELEMNKYTKDSDLLGLELSRDLSMAISEYAPGCQIVANNRLVTSKYIKTMPAHDWKKYDYIECENCMTLNIVPHQIENETHPLKNCKQCGEELEKKDIKTFLIPEFGFIASNDIEKPSLIKPEKTYRTEASFFAYNDNEEENEYLIGNTKINISMIGNNGEMALLNKTDFFVCPYCGYAEEVLLSDGLYKKTKKIQHKEPNGYSCNCAELERFSLGYRFKTDVIRLKIDMPLLSGANAHDEAYSILQAIILSACKELNIEQSEIAGCLQYYYNKGENYSYILYDKTPGGAGHVKRLNNKDSIYHVLVNAMNLAQKCHNCDEDSSCYSCLRTYQNQKHHDIIKRNYVFNYLCQILNGYNDYSLDSKLEDNFLLKLQNNSSKWIISGNDKNIYFAKFGNQEWKIEPQVYLDLKQNVKSPSKPDFILTPKDEKQKRIAVFTDGFSYHNNILNKDSIKRDSIIYSGNYRVWNFSWNDIVASKDEKFATNIFNKNNFVKISNVNKLIATNNNSFDLLLLYLSNSDSEKMFNEIANEYFDAMIGKNYDKKEIISELSQINDQISLFESDNIQKIDKYKANNDSVFNVYLINDGEKKVVSYIQDYVNKRNNNFIYDWNAYLQFNNIMQYLDNFIEVTQTGLDEEQYTILTNIEKIDNNKDKKWAEILTQVIGDDAKQFVKDCIENNVVYPTHIGYELDDGSIAEMEWEKLNIVYLTTEQMEYKEKFEEKGFDVINSLQDFDKLTKEQ